MYQCRYRYSETKFPIVVSLDCDHQPTVSVVRTYGDKVTLILVGFYAALSFFAFSCCESAIFRLCAVIYATSGVLIIWYHFGNVVI